MEILEVRNVKKYYGKNDNLVKALDDVSFKIGKGEFVAIVGQSGSGKSTLLNLIGGLDKPTSGSIIINGKDISCLSPKKQTEFRRKNIGFIFQNYSLMPELCVYDNVALPVSIDRSQKTDHEYIKRILTDLGIWEKRKKLPHQLSGGQQQRTAIARALANKPAIILADEPTGNLDSGTTMDVMELLRTSCKEYSQTMIMVTHNDMLAASCDRILSILDGKIERGY